MNKEQVVKYLQFSGFGDEQIKAIEGAFTCETCEDAISKEAVFEQIGGWIASGEYEFTNATDYLSKRIKALPPVTPQPKTGWIPVSKRLPEINKEVIVTDNETSDTYQSRYIGKGYWECDNGTFNNRIIAWMPKPKPYKAEGSDKE